MNEVSEETYEQLDEEMSTAPAMTNNNKQAVTSKNIVLDLGWFNRNKMKFEN